MTPANNCSVLETIIKIQAGDSLSREDFLTEYKPFVAKTAMNLCKRPLDWGVDDELSIGLIAFNSAIDSYLPEKMVPFLPYAKVVIENRLKDLFRKESRLAAEFSLEVASEEGKIIHPAEIQAAWDDFKDRTIEDERREELSEYEEFLTQFGVDFEALSLNSPKHRDSRENLIRVAKIIADTQELTEYLLKKKQLPIGELILKTKINRKTLERGRKFIIATALLLCFSMKFPYIHSYVKLGSN